MTALRKAYDFPRSLLQSYKKHIHPKSESVNNYPKWAQSVNKPYSNTLCSDHKVIQDF